VDSQQLMCALQSPVGLRFGSTTQVDADRVTFEIDLKIPKGIQCEFRMELSGSDTTVMGTVLIERVFPKRGDNLPRYQGKIVEMPLEDRHKFDGWRRDLATGGVSRQMERNLEALKQEIAVQMAALSEGEDAVSDIPDQAAIAARDQKRERMREALRADQEDKSEPEPAVGFSVLAPESEVLVPESDEDEITEVVEPVAVAEPDEEVNAPAWLPQPAFEPPPPPTPPLVVVNSGAHPIELTIIYLSQDSFLADYQATLAAGAVTVAHPEIKELYQPVNVKLQLYNGDAVETTGHAVAQTPQGMAIAMEFDSKQRAILKAATEG